MKIDVLIPHYNDVDGLIKSVNSIKRQSWKGGLRALVADDGSHPDIRRRVAEFIQGCGLETKLIFNEENRGRPYTRNALLQAVEAPIVCWLDAGDEWYPEKLAVQAEVLLRYDAKSRDRIWVTCTYDLAWPTRELVTKKVRTEGDQLKNVMQGKLLGYLWTMMGTKESFLNVGAFDASLPRLQDTDFVIRFLAGGGTIVDPADENPLCVYYKFDNGKSASQVYECSQHILKKHNGIYRRFGRSFHSKVKFHYELLAARFAGNNGERERHRRHLLRALRLKPLRFLALAVRGRIPRIEFKF